MPNNYQSNNDSFILRMSFGVSNVSTNIYKQKVGLRMVEINIMMNHAESFQTFNYGMKRFQGGTDKIFG